jgi:maleamate amidohydrolase
MTVPRSFVVGCGLGSARKGPPAMELSNKTARQLFAEIREKPTRARFGFGRKPALVNIDLQKAYTAVGEFATAYETDPRQLAYVNELAELARGKGLPVVWTYVAYMDSGEDCGVWGTRSNTPDSLQNIKVGSRRSEFDDRLCIDSRRDIIMNKRMASAFHETNLPSLLTFYRTIVPEECVADKHESPHFANLYDMAVKYADVVPVAEVITYLRAYEGPN